MAEKEFKSYDSPFFGEYYGAKIATDPTCVANSDGKPMVRFKVVAESRNERFSKLWVEVNVQQFNANAASFLQKGDVIHCVRGRIALRIWGDDNDKQSVSLEFAELTLGGLITTLRERGFDPQGEPNWTDDSGSKKNKKGGKDKKKGDQKKSGKPAKKEVEIPPDEDEDDASDDEDTEIADDEDAE